MTQIFYKFLPIISYQKKLIFNTKIPLQTQPKITPLFYLRLILIIHNSLKHSHILVETMINLLFHLNLQRPTTLIILHNQVLLILNTHIQSIFKHQLHLRLLKYKLQRTVQLKIIQYKMSKPV